MQLQRNNGPKGLAIAGPRFCKEPSCVRVAAAYSVTCVKFYSVIFTCSLLILTGCACPPHIVLPSIPIEGKLRGTFRVDSRRHWNSTGLRLEKGHSYCFYVPPDQNWTDWFIKSGPEGYCKWYMRWAQPFRRVRSADWFTLIGCLAKDSRHPLIVGSGLRTFRSPKTSELFFFANDMFGMYWNNRGSVDVVVYEIKPIP